MRDLFVKKCDCGAITVHEHKQNWSMPEEKFNEILPDTEIQDGLYSNCNYCVNHWGIDFCACGSGEKYNKCQEGLSMCGTPMQTIGKIQDITPKF